MKPISILLIGTGWGLAVVFWWLWKEVKKGYDLQHEKKLEILAHNRKLQKIVDEYEMFKKSCGE